jgi:hypothetical protein
VFVRGRFDYPVSKSDLTVAVICSRKMKGGRIAATTARLAGTSAAPSEKIKDPAASQPDQAGKTDDEHDAGQPAAACRREVGKDSQNDQGDRDGRRRPKKNNS